MIVMREEGSIEEVQVGITSEGRMAIIKVRTQEEEEAEAVARIDAIIEEILIEDTEKEKDHQEIEMIQGRKEKGIRKERKDMKE